MDWRRRFLPACLKYAGAIPSVPRRIRDEVEFLPMKNSGSARLMAFGSGMSGVRPTVSESTLRRLSPTEWRIMATLWELKLAKPAGIASHLRTSFNLDVPLKRLRALLARLEGLRYVHSASPPTLGRGRPSLLYVPVVSRDHAVRQQLEVFLEDFTLDRSALAELLTE
jgi:hypothetical protein